ncbi:splicing factor U2af small subunit A-like [Solanum tuberosum]|uniref:splicing factor U2af small subunit A-like n=1 Tax=Solanum tuberosum TaxID=4113 RepID=UPI00073A32D9|nr:PREDICTED: splicing factor U2af small subunit A-like [Solanum tuberosum]
MTEHLASIFGAEKDSVNCPFYFKIGACRHGDRGSRLHTKPSISPTLLLPNMYQRPDVLTRIDPLIMQQHFEIGSLGGSFDGMSLILMMLQDFYEDLFEELNNYGEIENLNICDNIVDHMVGNVYVQFREEEQAAKALKIFTGRLYAGNIFSALILSL